MGENAHRTRVLVVGDEPAIADSFALILNQNGFDAMAVHSGEHAIAAAESFKPDILLTDVMMPGVNGIDAALTIRSALPGCKVLLISGNPGTGALLQAMQAKSGAFEILPKPLHPGELIHRLRGNAAVAGGTLDGKGEN